MSTNLPILWLDKKNSPELEAFLKQYGDQYCMKAEEINQLRDAVNEMGVIQQSADAVKARVDIATVTNNQTNYTGGVITFIDDDARPDFRTVWQPILNANPDVKISIAVVKDWTLAGSALPISELITLQNSGHDLLCHSTHHEASYLISPANAELDYPEAAQWMKENNMNGYEYLVYPGGLSNLGVSIKNVARKTFKYAVSTPTAGTFAIAPVDNWCLPRIDGDVTTLANLKIAVDTAKTNGYWLIVMTHSHVLLSSGSTKMTDFIAYIKAQNVPIMKFTDAVKIKGNAVAIGEYTNASDKKLFISHDGKSSLIKDYNYSANAVVMDKLLTGYISGTTTIQTVNYLQDNFLGQGGTLTTYRTLNDAYGFQEFLHVTKPDKYVRKWDSTNLIWKVWEKINAATNAVIDIDTASNPTMDDAITTYPVRSVRIKQIQWQQDTLLGNVGGGTMEVYRNADDFYSYATYTHYADNTVYMRKWNKPSAVWRAWKRISANLTLTTTGRNALIPLALTVGEQLYDSTLGKPLWLKTIGTTGANSIWVDANGTVV